MVDSDSDDGDKQVKKSKKTNKTDKDTSDGLKEKKQKLFVCENFLRFKSLLRVVESIVIILFMALHDPFRGTCPFTTTCAMAHPGLRDSAVMKRKKPSIRDADESLAQRPYVYLCPHSDGWTNSCSRGKNCSDYHLYVRPSTADIILMLYPIENGIKSKLLPGGAVYKGKLICACVSFFRPWCKSRPIYQYATRILFFKFILVYITNYVLLTYSEFILVFYLL